jgi:hypothetical protein
MSKITRLEQLKSENSLYRVSGVFEKSEIVDIRYHRGMFCFGTVVRPFRLKRISPVELEAALSNGSITIMCLQRGEEL